MVCAVSAVSSAVSRSPSILSADAVGARPREVVLIGQQPADRPGGILREQQLGLFLLAGDVAGAQLLGQRLLFALELLGGSVAGGAGLGQITLGRREFAGEPLQLGAAHRQLLLGLLDLGLDRVALLAVLLEAAVERLDAQLDAPEFLLPGLALRPGRRERQQRTQDEDNDRTGAHRRKGSEIIEASGFRPT